MFFILAHGWDGNGYQRFFSPTHEDFVNWDGDWAAWFTSDVAFTLLGMGVVLVPLLLWAAVAWQLEGYRLATANGRRPGKVAIIALTMATVFGAGRGLSVAASLLIHALGITARVPAAIALVALALVPRGPVHALYRAYGLPGAEETRGGRLVAPAGRAVRAAA
jgi:hypothetical protein